MERARAKLAARRAEQPEEGELEPAHAVGEVRARALRSHLSLASRAAAHWLLTLHSSKMGSRKTWRRAAAIFGRAGPRSEQGRSRLPRARPREHVAEIPRRSLHRVAAGDSLENTPTARS